jgi:hypothetical protein
MTQPFKQAFAEGAKVSISDEKEIVTPRASLAKLSQGNNNKAPSAQNIQSLKDVLAGVMAKKDTPPEPKKEAFPSAEAMTQVSRSVERAKELAPKAPMGREIPEDVLRKVLE